jgi:hypothetical protein
MNPYTIDWSKVCLPKRMTKELYIQRFESSLNDLVHFTREFEKFFYGKRKKANRGFHTNDLIREINETVKYSDKERFDLMGLMRIVDPTDKSLFIDVAHYTLSYFYHKSATTKTLEEFKLMLLYFLWKLGF